MCNEYLSPSTFVGPGAFDVGRRNRGGGEDDAAAVVVLVGIF